MCGRYQLILPFEEMRRLFALSHDAEPFPPRYNIAPTQPVHVVRADRERRTLVLMRWGLLPSWVKDPQAFPLLINARSETAADKPAFRNALRRRRVLVPASGFYEWTTEGRAKLPHLFEAGPLAFAGIAETWCGPNGEEMDTVAILTAAAEGIVARYHTRMPLVVPAERYAAWLDVDNDDGAVALTLAGEADWSVRPVSRRLSNARNEGAALMMPDREADPSLTPQPASATPATPAGGSATAPAGDTLPEQPRLL